MRKYISSLFSKQLNNNNNKLQFFSYLVGLMVEENAIQYKRRKKNLISN